MGAQITTGPLVTDTVRDLCASMARSASVRCARFRLSCGPLLCVSVCHAPMVGLMYMYSR